jgi:Arc/MetJ-type ribon-helix-helix transcriptional regulator
MHPLVPLAFSVALACPPGPGFNNARLTVALPPVPAWQSLQRAELTGQHVFIDERTRDIIVSIRYPKDSGKTDVFESQQFSIGVCPSDSIKVTKARSAENNQLFYFYEYRVGNLRTATQNLRVFFLLIPRSGVTILPTPPRDWRAEVWNPSDSVIAGESRQDSTAWGMEQGRRIQRLMSQTQIRWSAPLADFAIAPGHDGGPFLIRTDARPGIVSGYFRGSVFPLTSREEWDIQVSVQLASLGNELNSSISMPILGPKFPPAATSEAIAKDYVASIDRLIKEGKLSSDSIFIKEAVSKLTEWAGSSDTTRPARAAWRSKPMPGLESEILLGIQLSLEN